MNAIELLTQQHREVDELFAQLAAATDLREKEAVFAKLADALAVHTRIEEEHFYPASLAAAAELEMKLREGVEEHLSAKRILSDLLETDVDDPEFEAKCRVLKEQIRHHVGEEEKQVFPAVARVMTPEWLDALGATMRTLALDLGGREPRNFIPMETLAAAPIERPVRKAA